MLRENTVLLKVNEQTKAKCKSFLSRNYETLPTF